MNDTILIALISAFPPTLVALLAWRSNSKKIDDVHLVINSRMDQLLSSSKAESRAEGREAGRNEKT